MSSCRALTFSASLSAPFQVARRSSKTSSSSRRFASLLDFLFVRLLLFFVVVPWCCCWFFSGQLSSSGLDRFKAGSSSGVVESSSGVAIVAIVAQENGARRVQAKTMHLGRTTNEVEAGVQTRAKHIDSQKLCRLFVLCGSSDETTLIYIWLIEKRSKERQMYQPLRSDHEKL
jgi:predicted nicotinamide N-methyase